MMKKLVVISCALLALVSCTKDKEVTYDHPVSAEFGANTVHKTDAILYADFSDKTGDEIKETIKANPSDLILLQLPSSIDAVDAGEWIESVRAEYGYSSASVVSEGAVAFAALSNLNTASFDFYQMSESKALQVKYGDYYFLVADPTADDVKYVSTNIAKTSDNNVIFFFQLDAPSEEIEGMVFTDCIDAQYGPEAFPDRTDYVYAGPGVWNKMGAISLNPVRFTIFSEEK